MSSKAIGPDDKIPCPTVDTLLWELEKLEEALEGAEKEETWERFERGILRFAAVTRGGGHKFTEVYIEGMGVKGLGPRVVECMLSDRGRLSGVATDFLTSMAPRLGPNFSSLIPLYIPPTIRLLARPNKCGIEDKNEACRRSCGGALERIMREWNRDLIGNKGLIELEMAMRRMATEKDAEVRKIGKRMWENYISKWPERIEEFTAPLTPTIKKYLDISQTKSSTSRTLFNAPAVRVKHPLSQTTNASESSAMARPTLASRQASSSLSVNKDRNLQAIRGLGRSAEAEATVKGIKPFLLRSTSAMVSSSTNVGRVGSTAMGGRTGLLRSASAANFVNEQHLEDDDVDENPAEIPSAGLTLRPRVLTHASTPELMGAAVIRTHAQRGAGALPSGSGPARRARIVSGFTQVREDKAGGSSGAGIGMGRPQGAVRPTGRVVSSSATIGVGSRNVSGAKPLDGRNGHASAIKPKMLVTSVLEQKKASEAVSLSTSTSKKVGSGDSQTGEEETRDGKTSTEASIARSATPVAKTVTTNPGGTMKTRQFFRPTPTNTGPAALRASTASNTSATNAMESHPYTDQKRTLGRTTGTVRTGGGLTAPTASSGAKVVHRALPDPSKANATSNSVAHNRDPTPNLQQLQAKLVVSPRKPRQKLKPPVPAFMPVSRNPSVKDGKTPSSTLAPTGARVRVKPQVSTKAARVEPANIPLPASPAPKSTGQQKETGHRTASDCATSPRPASPPTKKDETVAVAATGVPLPPSPPGTASPLPEQKPASAALSSIVLEYPTVDGTQAAVSSAVLDTDPSISSVGTSISDVSTVRLIQLADEESTDDGDVSHGSVTFKKKNDQGLRETLARASAARAMANEQNIPPQTIAAEVNLIDFGDPESPKKPSLSLSSSSPAKRTPLGPASPNQIMSVKKGASTTAPSSPKVKQLQDFFEKRAFSPSPSPERQPSTVQIGSRRASTTPTATPPRPRVLG
ncbi:hypothetical protein QFC19_001372 [Naganishia cerealis]|uniref:Uncharacterized protein n=1 Tax=Naganishia cerealis TaxID=610337 RepID=A0ACC2WHC0_9TREE|nr:hypothetical protein QFC19_001372 [Naganishia cerealis]